MERVMEIREDSREVEVLARDGTLLRIDPRIRFAFQIDSAETFVFGVRRPLEHIRDYYRCIVGSEIARFGDQDSREGSYAAIRKSRSAFQEGLRLRQGDAERRYGIGFRSADLVEILPPADLAEALNSVQKADAQNETLLRRVQAECEQRIVSAEHGLEIAQLHAEAIEKEIDILGEAVSTLKANGSLNSYIQRRRDEAASASKTLYLRT
jgi:regulator of protease activity HflC (stomatin/prohibitin superfamily)